MYNQIQKYGFRAGRAATDPGKLDHDDAEHRFSFMDLNTIKQWFQIESSGNIKVSPDVYRGLLSGSKTYFQAQIRLLDDIGNSDPAEPSSDFIKCSTKNANGVYYFINI